MIAEGFTQLCFHALAHVRLDGPGALFDPRYLAWTRARCDGAEVELLDHDAALLARLWRNDARYERLHRFCDLHRSLAAFAACKRRPLSELRAEEVAEPELLAGLRELEGAELLHATLALLGPGFARALAEHERELEQAAVELDDWLEGFAVHCPGLADARVELVWALGPHGRALPGRILVGAPGWSGCSVARQAVLAAHEQTLARVARGDYVDDEWSALIELAGALREAEPKLRAAHRDWLASVEIGPLLDAVLARGYLGRAEAEALNFEIYRRADRLSAARAGGSG